MDIKLSERAHELFLSLTVACRKIEGHALLTDSLLVAAGRLSLLMKEVAWRTDTPRGVELLREAEKTYREVSYWFETLDRSHYFAEADSNRIGTLCRRFGSQLTRALAEQRRTMGEDERYFRRPRIFCTSSRLCLRRFQREDSSQVYRLACDSAVRDSGFPLLASEEEAITQLARWQEDTSYLAVAHVGDEALVGYVSLVPLRYHTSARRLSLGLLPEWRGIGYGDELLTARLDLAFFAEFRLEAVIAHCLTEADAYRRILERNGFRLDAALPHEGRNGQPLLSYSHTRADWQRERGEVRRRFFPCDGEDEVYGE